MPDSPTYPSRPASEVDPTGEFERAQAESSVTGSGNDFAIVGDRAFLTIANRLRNWVTDWNDEPMVRGEPPRDGLHCDDLYDAASALDRQADEIAALKAENERLRRALEPFAKFGADNTDSHGWAGLRCERERINVWFGPSDFYTARTALKTEPESHG